MYSKKRSELYTWCCFYLYQVFNFQKLSGVQQFYVLREKSSWPGKKRIDKSCETNTAVSNVAITKKKRKKIQTNFRGLQLVTKYKTKSKKIKKFLISASTSILTATAKN